MKFFMIIERNAIYTYEKNGQHYDLQYIEGSKSFSYSMSSIYENINEYLDALANEKNLGTKAMLEFDVLESSEEFCNIGVINALEGYIEKKYNINEAIEMVIKKLSKDKGLMIDHYGINYDGYSFLLVDGQIQKGEFDLLAYTVHSDDVIGLMDTN